MSMRSTRRLVVLAVGTMLLSVACGSAEPVDLATAIPDVVEPLEEVPVPQLPVTVISADGTEVEVTDVDRLVPLTGAISEVVFTLGLGDNVVGRDVTATFDQAADLPVVTRGHDVSAEGVLSLHPTLVLASLSTGPAEAMEQIRAAGIPVIIFDGVADLADVDRNIAQIADALGVSGAGEQLRARTAERIAAVQETVPDGTPPRVAFLYLRGSASIYLIGGERSGASGLIEAAGAVDAGKEAGFDADFTPITSEAMAAAAPDVILVMTKGLESVGGIDGLLELPGIAQTPAGLDRRVVWIDDGIILNYGPRTDQVLASLVDQIYRSAQS
ncbi:iron complex transport system substrate-binding protein [Stackebrandtia endophytica]|uniref:Iron complex transport system substrate-binding protein n=1 Tax=Stackebrandtia endophytica TaxID=1496996 RepID=A0A543ATX3_9ACTN|nr:ABC transporter substrate-binding protein [Stackebrandtia endophytica]TQL76040.1 iron complex transport system substrate-binding protein [Stackebrandtia endophytica]